MQFRTDDLKIRNVCIGAVLAAVLLSMNVFAGEKMVGGWTATTDVKITEEAQEAFDKAVEKLVGVNYEPVDLLATQVVAGTNYCFLCRAAAVVPDAVPSYALVYVYKDLQGGAQILGIKDIKFGEGILEEKAETSEN